MSGVALWAGVALLGGTGALLRYLAELRVAARRPGRPWAGTLIVNVTGSLALGALAGAGLRGDALLLTATALVGSYTTFSTWMLQARRLGVRAGGAYVLASLALGLLAVWAGRAIAG